ncbi:MAG: VanZ family protein [Clostridiaceae bacterium]|nr:VanZ family protein [Clostridiaceae bacterium]
MSSFKDYFIQMVPIIFISMPFVLVHRILEIKKRKYKEIKTSKYRELGVIALMYSLIFIITVTIGISIFFMNVQYISENIHYSIESINLIPFKGILDTPLLDGLNISAHNLVNFFGNVSMFIPLGFCTALLSQKEKRKKNTILTGVVVSISVEIIQIFAIRSLDINDIILNILGALLGLKLLNLLEKPLPNFFYKFHSQKTVKELSLKEKLKANIITILQIAVWIIMIVNLKQMIKVFDNIFHI